MAKTTVGEYEISTVFLGLDHNFFGNGPPILYETMIFAASDDATDEMWRYATREQALAHHQKLVVAMRRTEHAKRARLRLVK